MGTRLEVKRRLELLKDEIVAAYTDQGKTLRELAIFHECSTGSIRNFLRSCGVTLRNKGRKPKE